MQFVTASLTAVFRSDSTLTGGSNCATNAATAIRANPSLMLLAGKTHFMLLLIGSARLAIAVAPFDAE